MQFLAEKFTPGVPYSAAVDERKRHGVGSVSAALNLVAPRKVIPVAPDFEIVQAIVLGENKAPVTPLEATFEEAAKEMVKRDPKATAQNTPRSPTGS